jgi:hypothetical protein
VKPAFLLLFARFAQELCWSLQDRLAALGKSVYKTSAGILVLSIIYRNIKAGVAGIGLKKWDGRKIRRTNVEPSTSYGRCESPELVI